MKIANIIYKDELVNHEKVDFINYINEPKTLKEVENSGMLPTLYVGWNFLKESNPEDADKFTILNKQIAKDFLYWEFSFKEKKSDHIDGIELFVNNAPYHYFVSRYKYTNIDPVFFMIQSIEDLLKYLPKKVETVYSFKNQMLYVLSEKNIFGVDLKMYKYFDFNIDLLVENVCARAENCIVDEDGEIHKKYYKIFPFFDLLKRYVVVLVSNS